MTPDEQPQPVASELLPCPFCGSVAEFVRNPRNAALTPLWWAVCCTNADCLAVCMTATADRRINAAKNWNTRAHPPTSAASQPDAVRVTDEMIAGAQDSLNGELTMMCESTPGCYLQDYMVRAALEAALNPPAESSARGDVK